MIRGITKVRNEAHIIQSTLDVWARYCDGIHVYDDCSTDGTAEICKAHPAVVEVIESDHVDPNRERAEWYNRHTVFHSAHRFLKEGDWICYFDADEHLEVIDQNLFKVPNINLIAVQLFDAYITAKDVDEHWSARRYVAPEFQPMPYFYKYPFNGADFCYPDQRILYHGNGVLAGKARHWGKAISVPHWERKCEYYSKWPKYADKWEARHGKAVHDESDFGNPLVLWEDILNGSVEPMTTFIDQQGEASA